MHKPTPSAKRLQRNRHHATIRRRQIMHARRYEESVIAHESTIADKMGLERKMDIHHKRKDERTWLIQ